MVRPEASGPSSGVTSISRRRAQGGLSASRVEGDGLGLSRYLTPGLAASTSAYFAARVGLGNSSAIVDLRQVSRGRRAASPASISGRPEKGEAKAAPLVTWGLVLASTRPIA